MSWHIFRWQVSFLAFYRFHLTFQSHLQYLVIRYSIKSTDTRVTSNSLIQQLRPTKHPAKLYMAIYFGWPQILFDAKYKNKELSHADENRREWRHMQRKQHVLQDNPL